MSKTNLIAEANRLYKLLKQADKGGESFAKDAYKQLDRLIKSVGKRTFNTRGLTKAQKMHFKNAAQKFLSSKTSTLEGAKDTYSKRDIAFNNIVRQNYYYKPENLELYRDTIKKLDASGYFEEMGTSPIWDDIIRDVNDWASNSENKIVNSQNQTLENFVKESIQMRTDQHSAWEFYHVNDDPVYLFNTITNEIVKEGDPEYEALYQMVSLKELLN